MARTIVTRLRAEMDQFKRAWDSGTKSVDATAKSLDKAALRAKTAATAMDQSTSMLGQLSGALKNSRSEWDTVGTSLLRGGAALTALSGLTIKAAMDWESAWAGVTKTTSGTEAQMATLESGLRNLAKTLPSSHAEIAAVAEAAGQLGVKRGDIVSFTKTMIDLGETTNLTADDAATSIAQLMNVMGTAPSEVDNLGSTLVALGNDGASTEKQILEMAQRIAGAGKIVGASEGEILALANALASVGIEAEAGGTSASKILIDISKAVATGSPDLAKWADVAAKGGLATKDFTQTFKDDPIEAFNAFTNGLGQINAEGGDVFSLLESLGQSDVRVTQALLGMANSGDLLSDSLKLQSAEWARNSALTDEAEKRYDTTAAKAEIAWNGIKDSAIDAGQSMLPVVAQMAEAVSSVASVFSSLPGPIKGGVGALAGVAGVSLLAVGGIMKVAGSVMDTRTAFNRLSTEAPRLGSAIGAVGKAAGVAAAAFTSFQVAGALIGDSGDAKGVSTFTKALLGVSDGTKDAKAALSSLFDVNAPGYSGMLYKDIKGIGEALKEVADGKGAGDRIQGFLGIDTRISAASKAVKQLDTALAGLVSGGAIDEAGQGFDYVAQVAEKQGISVEKLRSMLPSYKDALDGADVQQRIAGESAKGLGDDLGALTPEAQAAKEELDALKASTAETALSFLDFSKDLDKKSMSFATWIQGLEDMAKAQANWQDNMLTAQSLGATEETLAKFEELGPAGAKMLDEMVNGGKKSVDQFNGIMSDAGSSADKFSRTLHEALANIPAEVRTAFVASGDKDAADKAAAVAHEYNLTPSEVKTILKANDWATADIKAVLARMANLDKKEAKPKINAGGNALSFIDQVRNQMDALAGRDPVSLVINTIKRTTEAPGGYTGMRVPAGYAGGGRVPGTPPSDPRRDNVLAMTERGNPLLVRSREWIINETQSEKNDKWLRLINGGLNLDDIIPGFASGGRPSSLELKNQQRTIRDLERSLREREAYGKKRKGKKRPTRRVLRGLDRQIAQLELAEAKRELADLKSGRSNRAEAAAERRDDAISTRDSVASGLSGGFGLAQFIGKNAFGQDSISKPSEIAAGAKAYAAKLKAFAAKIEKARKKGIPTTMLQEIGGLGVEEGTLALDALLSASSSDLATIRTAYRDIDTYANGAGEVIAKALDLSAAGKSAADGYAKDFIKGLSGHAPAMGKAANDAAKGKKTSGTQTASASFVQPPRQTVVPLGWGPAPAPVVTATIAASDMDMLTRSVAAAIVNNPIAITNLLKIGGRDAVAMTDLSDQTKARQRQ